MFNKFNPLKYINYYNTLLVVLFLSILTLPLLWLVSGGNIIWVFTCVVIWGIGVFIIYYPFLKYIFPILITKTGTFLLGSILALFTLWLNSGAILSLISKQDIDLILNNFIFTHTVQEFAFVILGYIIVAGLFVSSLDLHPSLIANRRKSLFFSFYPNIFSKLMLHDYIIEFILVFILPFLVLFWTDITFSTRLILALLSITIGVSLFFHKLSIPFLHQRLVFSFLSLTAIAVINGTIFNIIGIQNIPASTLKSRISPTEILYDIEADKISNPSFQLTYNEHYQETLIYKILASFPSIGIYLGYKIDSIPTDNIRIESAQDRYTVYDQFNKELTHINK